MTRLLSEHEIRDRLRAEVRAAGSQREWARRHGVSVSHVNRVLHGKQRPYPTILSALGGFEAVKVVQYRSVA